MLRSLGHLLTILRVLCHHGLDEFVIPYLRSPIQRKLLGLLTKIWRRRSDENRAVRLREALQDLGPVFVKFGQVLSTRPDLLPPDLIDELSVLQDAVPPFDSATAIQVIERNLGRDIATCYAHFDEQPLASASVAQVHAARLHTGQEVVVKVLRPGITEIIERDLGLLHTIANLVAKHLRIGKRLRPQEIVADYDYTIHNELDLMHEAANASQLRINFTDSDLIYVPDVFWDFCARQVMTMERIDGISLKEIDRIRESGMDMRKLAHDGVEIFFTQAFRDGFFHADMHPGNIFVAESGQYRAIDFGIMGTLNDQDKHYLAENLLAFFNRDYKRVADAHIRAGWVPADTVAEHFEAAVRSVCEPIFAKPISEISFGSFLLDLFRVAHRFEMPMQPQLVLLQKTLFNIEGLGRQLYPELDLWDTAKPFLEKWMNDVVGPKAVLKAMRNEIPQFVTRAPELPRIMHQVLARVNNEQLTLQTNSSDIRQLRDMLLLSQRKTRLLIIAAALAAGCFLSGGNDPQQWSGWIILLGLIAALCALQSWRIKPQISKE